MPFTIGFSFSATLVPIFLIIIIGVFVVALIIYTYFNGVHLFK